MAIVGQASPALDGIGDWLEGFGIEVFSPSAKNTLIEASKSYMRQFLTRNNIEGNIEYAICTDKSDVLRYLEQNLEVAVKPDGLTGGDGVRVSGDHLNSKEEILEYANSLISSDGIVVLEEKINGTEFSLQGFAHGEEIGFLPLVKDYKRAYNDDKGPNTGSMGSCSFPDHTLPYLSDAHLSKAKQIMRDVLKALKQENGPYKGAIYGQFMITESGPQIIEFNARLGDPEAFNIFAILETPILDLIDSLSKNSIDNIKTKFAKRATCVVYLVPDGFPENTQIGNHVLIPLDLEEHIRIAYVNKIDGVYTTTKKRSFVVVGTGGTLSEARKNVYSKIPENFKGVRFRTDIAEEFD